MKLSVDGTRIVYTAFDGSDLEVRTAPLAGGASTLVAGGPADDMQPDISPDGKRVVFVSNRAGNNDLYVAPTVGGDAVRLLDWASAEVLPAWSPDGQWIAFLSSKESDNDVWLVKPDGSGARRLTNSGAEAGFRWSHDGRLITYASSTADGGSAVFVSDVATGRVRTVASGQYVGGVFWPGDSVMSVARLEGGMARLELRRVADGALVRPLSATEGRVYEGFGVQSPDGQYVALSQFTFKGNDYLPAVRNMAGTETRVLSNLRGNTFSLQWLPDSKAVVFGMGGDLPRMYRKRFTAK